MSAQTGNRVHDLKTKYILNLAMMTNLEGCELLCKYYISQNEFNVTDYNLGFSVIGQIQFDFY